MRYTEFIANSKYRKLEITESRESLIQLFRRADVLSEESEVAQVEPTAKQQSMNNYEVKQIPKQDAKPFILDIHYLHRLPTISYAYGLFRDNELVGVVTYGPPGSPTLRRKICGPEFAHLVLDLNRVVLKDNRKNEASMLIGRSLKLLPSPRIIVSYADATHGHVGYVYQACNFLFTGTTESQGLKHRYVTFVGNKKEVSVLRNALTYQVSGYPKPQAN